MPAFEFQESAYATLRNHQIQHPLSTTVAVLLGKAQIKADDKPTATIAKALSGSNDDTFTVEQVIPISHNSLLGTAGCLVANLISKIASKSNIDILAVYVSQARSCISKIPPTKDISVSTLLEELKTASNSKSKNIPIVISVS